MRLSLPGGDHEVEVDVEATAACYARLLQRGPEQCECAYCANWVAARSSVIAGGVAQLLAQMGIPSNGEIEVWQTPGSVKANFYGGWYYFVGRLVRGNPSQTFRVGELEFSFGSGSYAIEAFSEYEPCELHFVCEIDNYLTDEEYLAATRRSEERLAQSYHSDEPSRMEVARNRLGAAVRRIAY